MNKHILFLIHGMGVHKKNWADTVINKLKELSKDYTYFNENKLTDLVKFVPIDYDHVIRDVLNKWQEDSRGIRDFAKENGLDDKNLLSWLKRAGDTERNFLWSSVADVIIYRFFRVYSNRIRIDVIKELSDEINSEINEFGDARCSVLAHSLGTAVVHDCLHHLGAENWGDTQNVFGPTHWRFQSIFMIANTSRLLQTEPKAYDSIVRPGPNLDSNSYCFRYLNFRHELDPVPYPRMFDPIGWSSAYQSIIVQHYRDLGIHGLEHYLDNPRVHIIILRAVTSRWAITEQEAIKAVDNYRQFGEKFEAVEKIRDFLNELAMLKNELGQDLMPVDFIKGFIKFYQVINKHLKGIS